MNRIKCAINQPETSNTRTNRLVPKRKFQGNLILSVIYLPITLKNDFQAEMQTRDLKAQAHATSCYAQCYHGSRVVEPLTIRT